MNPYLDDVELYLHNKLKLRLQNYGVSTRYVNDVIANVQMQIYSFIKIWKDIDLRRSLCIVGLEEGWFYTPQSKLDIRCFVVIAIRNSLVESIQSNAFRTTGLSQPIPGNPIKEITQEAITYFNKLDFDSLCDRMNAFESSDCDYYTTIFNKYPAAREALRQVGLSNAKKIVYSKVSVNPLVIDELKNLNLKNINAVNKVILDGMSEEWDEVLTQILVKISRGEMDMFYTDCFKFVTRNFKKLMKVMEFVLTNHSAFVTNNYYIENGYIERRTSVVKASHNIDESMEALSNYRGLGKKHKCALKQLVLGMKTDTESME